MENVLNVKPEKLRFREKKGKQIVQVSGFSQASGDIFLPINNSSQQAFIKLTLLQIGSQAGSSTGTTTASQTTTDSVNKIA